VATSAALPLEATRHVCKAVPITRAILDDRSSWLSSLQLQLRT